MLTYLIHSGASTVLGMLDPEDEGPVFLRNVGISQFTWFSVVC